MGESWLQGAAKKLSLSLFFSLSLHLSPCLQVCTNMYVWMYVRKSEHERAVWLSCGGMRGSVAARSSTTEDSLTTFRVDVTGTLTVGFFLSGCEGGVKITAHWSGKRLAHVSNVRESPSDWWNCSLHGRWAAEGNHGSHRGARHGAHLFSHHGSHRGCQRGG